MMPIPGSQDATYTPASSAGQKITNELDALAQSHPEAAAGIRRIISAALENVQGMQRPLSQALLDIALLAEAGLQMAAFDETTSTGEYIGSSAVFEQIIIKVGTAPLLPEHALELLRER